MSIQVLAEDVASQIAAGEVVERPASVVKELVENAIDARATDIRIETQGGGISLIQVSDDGCGIPAAEVEVAFRRHSTSKLTTTDDLSHIRTLGFRGEALASIAAVSRMRVSTRTPIEAVSTELSLEAGGVVSRRDAGRPPGTTVTVRDLFYNVPARRKFLRTERTERRHIDAFVTRYAMAYPSIRLTLSHSDRIVFQSPGNRRLRDVVIAVYGMEVGAAALDILPSVRVAAPSIEIAGLISPPSLHRANRAFITLFVNGRWVQDSRITYAVVQAYHTFLPSGRYPIAVTMISVPPEDVDVNVHPAKAEVRFRDSDLVFRAVQKAVRNTLLASAPVPEVRPHATWESLAHGRRGALRGRLLGLQPQSEPGSHRGTIASSRASGDIEIGQSRSLEDGMLPPLRLVGQVGAVYVIAEGPEGLYLIDQHAAHERILFEQMMDAYAKAQIVSQTLLEPELVDLSPEASTALEPHLETIARLGFRAEPFGRSTLLVRAVPATALGSDPSQLLEDVAAALLRGDTPMAVTAEEAIVRVVCKRAAMKAGQTLAPEEMAALIRDLEQCASPRTCPHGRPTMIHLSAAQLAREFGR